MMRGLDRQTVVLGDLRTRASIVLSASGIIASILGAEGLKQPHPLELTVLALSALALGLLCCVRVLWPIRDRGGPPRRKWRVTLTPTELRLMADGASEAELLERVVQAFAPWRPVNYSTIAWRTRVFNCACVLLLVQIVLWAALLLSN